MNENLDYLTDAPGIQENDKQVLSNLSAMADHLQQLAYKALEAEALYKQAQMEYDAYRQKVLPTAMLSAGVQSVKTSNGAMIEIKNKFYCNPNKNDTDRRAIGEWLSGLGAEHLIKRSATVAEDQIDLLKGTGVPFSEQWNMNTNSLKAWIKDQLGLTGGVAQISIGDIPECIHFVQIDEVELTTA